MSPTLFNVVVDNSIRTWQALTVEDQRVDHERLVETAGWFLGVFYADDGMVGSHKSDCLQNAMNIVVGLFRRYGLAANVVKSCTMTCHPVSLRVGVSYEAMTLNFTGVGDLY